MPEPSLPTEDPVLRHARREGIAIFAAWSAAAAYCTGFYALFGMTPTDGRPIALVLGIPWWFFWGVLAPWAACGVFTAWFVAVVMTEDDLGADRSEVLDAQIREGAADA